MVNQIGLEDTRPGRAPRYLDDAYCSDAAHATPAPNYEAERRNITRYFVTWKPEYEKYVRMHWGWTQSPDWPRFARVRAALRQMLTDETVVYDWQHIESTTLVIGGDKDTPTCAPSTTSTAPSAAVVRWNTSSRCSARAPSASSGSPGIAPMSDAERRALLDRVAPSTGLRLEPYKVTG